MEEKSEQKEFITKLHHYYKRMLPQVKEQFLRDLALTGAYNQRDFEEFMSMLELNVQAFQLILVQFGESCGYIEKFALKNIAENLFKSKGVYLSTVIEENVLLLVPSLDFLELTNVLNQMREIYKSYYRLELFVGVSSEGGFSDIRSMYKEVQSYLRFRFYFSEGCIVTRQDVQDNNRSIWHEDFTARFEAISSSIKAGDAQSAEDCLKEIFNIFKTRCMEINEVKAYCMELYMIIIRMGHCPPTQEQLFQVAKLQDLNSLQETFEYLRNVLEAMASSNYLASSTKRNRTIASVLQIVEENIDNPDLSLTWLGKELLYMNVDYLGRLFSREMGIKFSQYVLDHRMELAKRLIESENLKINEISKRTGFREETQYFQRVFKKYTSMTPSEYKQTCQMTANTTI
ncbi:HTH-type transcriptional regulator YesS [compost metagenome]